MVVKKTTFKKKIIRKSIKSSPKKKRIWGKPGKTLIFLESSTKRSTVKSFLGTDYDIFATGGHLLELQNSGPYNIGVDLENFKPNYNVIDRKKPLINFWNEYLLNSKPSQIFIATDPDREGEAIAREVVDSLNLKEGDYKRLFFYEITYGGVKNSLEKPLNLDKNLVEAQMSRQVLDKMIGFCLSSLLQKKAINAFSAGRVQSVALKLIVDREKEIEDYGNKKEFIINVAFSLKKHVFKLIEKNDDLSLKVYSNMEEAEKAKDSLGEKFNLIDKKKEEKLLFPRPALTTLMLLYEAKRTLKFSIDKTTNLLQKLYEGVSLKSKKNVSLITYPRTDSIRISKIFANKAYKYIEEKWDRDLCYFRSMSSPSKNSKTNTQDAHEAIRPTYLEHTPESLKDDDLDKSQLELYNLIFNHTIASLMQPAKYLNKIYYFQNNGRKFEMTENVIISPGFFLLLNKYYEKANINKKSYIEDENIQQIKDGEAEIIEYLWNKPQRYNEGSLIKKLEFLGIGRPSTYNGFSKIIIKRRYSSFDKRGNFVPTELGLKVNDWLQTNFSSLINENYTASLEEQLDKISSGENNYLNFIKNFWNSFFSVYKKLELES